MIMPYLVRLINNLFARNKKNNMTQDSKLEVVSGDTGFRSSSAYSNYVLGILFVVYVFNFVDRQIMSVFIGPIKAEFGVSDTAMGLLVGFAFALLYTVVGIPIARWADSGNRRNIIALGLAVWSAMTVFSGLARSFATLAIARVGVGVGEAAGSPPAHSLIADYFPLNRRATALAVYASGAFVGSGIAYLGGGYLREYFDWRTAFIVVGAPGILLIFRAILCVIKYLYSRDVCRKSGIGKVADEGDGVGNYVVYGKYCWGWLGAFGGRYVERLL